jgi:hypothetical protein
MAKYRRKTLPWDGLADTANDAFGEDYGTDWEYESKESANIVVSTPGGETLVKVGEKIMGKYRRRPQVVSAEQFFSESDDDWPTGVVRDVDGFFVLRTARGGRGQQIADGDWIVTEASGKQTVKGPEAFEAEFEAVV